MATKISEDTNVQLDLKTIAMIVGGAVSLASMWFTLQGEISALQNKIDSFSGDEFVQRMEFQLDEFVQRMEFQLKDELIRSNVIQIDNLTKNLKEDIQENKELIRDLEIKVFKR